MRLSRGDELAGGSSSITNRKKFLQASCCTEMFFPEREIRFIAAVNDVDSKKPGSGSEFLPFLNVMRLPQFRP